MRLAQSVLLQTLPSFYHSFLLFVSSLRFFSSFLLFVSSLRLAESKSVALCARSPASISHEILGGRGTRARYISASRHFRRLPLQHGLNECYTSVRHALKVRRFQQAPPYVPLSYTILLQPVAVVFTAHYWTSRFIPRCALWLSKRTCGLHGLNSS